VQRAAELVGVREHGRVLGASGGVAGQHRVEAAAGVAELVLEDDAVVVQLGLVEEH
jgi:hypothetical protein